MPADPGAESERAFPGRRQLLAGSHYIGALRYAGGSYEGRHEPLIDAATFTKVQDILAAQRQSGERSWDER